MSLLIVEMMKNSIRPIGSVKAALINCSRREIRTR